MNIGTENIILKKTIEFSLVVIEFTELLEANRKYIISKQLLRCGTSIGANVHEAQKCRKQSGFYS